MTLLYRETDPFTGMVEEAHYDPVEDKLTFQRFGDVAPILNLNKEQYNSHAGTNYSDSNGMHLVARIPLVVVELWKEQGFDWFASTDNERRAWLDKPENAFLKVRPGRLGGKINAKPLQSKRS